MSYAVLIFEGVVAVLLLGAVIMCWRVDRRLRALREGQDGLRGVIGELNDAVDRARASLAALDRAAKEHGASLEAQVEDAKRLSQELRFLNEGAEARAESLSRSRRREPVAGAQPRQSRSTGASRESSAESAEDGRLLDALKTLR